MDTMNLLFVYDYHDLDSENSFPFHVQELNLEDYDFWYDENNDDWSTTPNCSMYPFLMWHGRKPSETKIKKFLNTPKTVDFLRSHGFVSGKDCDYTVKSYA